VLSEGLNLQDCNKVINYDLHWNPVRLIQRFGRIDRIGTAHERIWAYNFLPEAALEAQLGLHEKLARRIDDIHQTIGEDAPILEPNEALNEEAMYSIYEGGDISRYEDDEVDEFVDLNEAEEIIRQLREDQPEVYQRITELRDGVRCGRATGQPGAIILCRAGDYRQLYHVSPKAEIISRDVPHVLNILKCEPQTLHVPLPPDYNGLITAVKAAFDSEVQARRAERQHTLSLTKGQQYVRRELRIVFEGTEDPDLRAQIGRLESAFAQPVMRPAVRSELNRVKREGIAGLPLVDALSRIYGAYSVGDSTVDRSHEAADPNTSLPRIIVVKLSFSLNH